jgi:hypothetical protein
MRKRTDSKSRFISDIQAFSVGFHFIHSPGLSDSHELSIADFRVLEQAQKIPPTIGNLS